MQIIRLRKNHTIGLYIRQHSNRRPLRGILHIMPPFFCLFQLEVAIELHHLRPVAEINSEDISFGISQEEFSLSVVKAHLG